MQSQGSFPSSRPLSGRGGHKSYLCMRCALPCRDKDYTYNQVPEYRHHVDDKWESSCSLICSSYMNWNDTNYIPLQGDNYPFVMRQNYDGANYRNSNAMPMYSLRMCVIVLDTMVDSLTPTAFRMVLALGVNLT